MKYAYQISQTQVLYKREVIWVEIELDDKSASPTRAARLARQIAKDGGPHDEQDAKTVKFQRCTKESRPAERQETVIDEVTETDVPESPNPYESGSYTVDCPVCDTQNDLVHYPEPGTQVKCRDCGYEFQTDVVV